MSRGTADLPTGLPESIFALRERAHHVRGLVWEFGHDQEMTNRLLDYADELDLKANAAEEADRNRDDSSRP